MQRWKACLAATLLVAVQSAHSQGGIAATMAADTIVTNIRNSLSTLIAEAESSATIVGFGFATDARLFLADLDRVAKGVSGKVFADLNESQKAFFNNAYRVVSVTNGALADRMSQAQTIVDSTGGELSRIPGFDDRPLLNGVGPTHFLSNGSTFEVRMFGSRLAGTRTHLKLGGNECTAITAIETSLRFNCPGLDEKEKSGYRTGEVSITRESPWWKFWASEETYTYPVGLLAVQEKLGTFELQIVERHPASSTIERSQSNGYRNNHCRGDRPQTYTYRPSSSACTIDVSSVRVQHSTAGRSTYGGIVNLSNTGFQVTGTVRNRGRCVGPVDDARGSLHVVARWKETCPSQPTEVLLEPQTGELSWTEEEAFQFTDKLFRYQLTVKQADGRTIVIDGTKDERWFTTSWDTNTKTLVWRPRPVTDAFSSNRKGL